MPTTTEGLKELENTARKDLGKVQGSPNRLLILMGKLNIPSDSKRNRSIFSMEKHAYLIEAPFRTSDYCCNIMKKKTGKKLKDYPILATMAEESRLRLQKWLENGCNGYDMKRPVSTPMAFWTESDVLEYIKENDLKIPDVYGEVVVKNEGVDGQLSIYEWLEDYDGAEYMTTGVNRTGCVFCGFGIRYDLDRFEVLMKNEPKICDYVLRGGHFVNGEWQPGNGGLGYWFILAYLNKYGGYEIKIPNIDQYRKYQNKETKKYLEI